MTGCLHQSVSPLFVRDVLLRDVLSYARVINIGDYLERFFLKHYPSLSTQEVPK